MSTKNIVKKSVAAAALCAALCGTAVAFPATASAAPAAAAAEAKGGPTASVGASLNVNVDVLGIANKIEASIKTAQNREGFVKGLMESAYYAAGGQYNVMVHNLQQPYEENLNGVKTFATTTYDGVTYGIWVFEDGEFTNQGDGGWINWAAKGYIERPNNGGLMIFTRH